MVSDETPLDTVSGTSTLSSFLFSSFILSYHGPLCCIELLVGPGSLNESMMSTLGRYTFSVLLYLLWEVSLSKKKRKRSDILFRLNLLLLSFNETSPYSKRRVAKVVMGVVVEIRFLQNKYVFLPY